MSFKSVFMRSPLVPVALLGASSIQAQDLNDGVWEGERTGPLSSSPVVKVDMNVTNRADGTISIYVLHVLGPAQATNVALEDGKLRYSFKIPGRDVVSECELNLQNDGGYSGPCVGDNGAEFNYSYRPPRDWTSARLDAE